MDDEFWNTEEGKKLSQKIADAKKLFPVKNLEKMMLCDGLFEFTMAKGETLFIAWIKGVAKTSCGDIWLECISQKYSSEHDGDIVYCVDVNARYVVSVSPVLYSVSPVL